MRRLALVVMVVAVVMMTVFVVAVMMVTVSVVPGMRSVDVELPPGQRRSLVRAQFHRPVIGQPGCADGLLHPRFKVGTGRPLRQPGTYRRRRRR